ncbi:MAG: hypothetical protein SOX82_05525 [Eubacteriales bacterium]|nr:hypothetical protein [Eubacteriales bacterium]
MGLDFCLDRIIADENGTEILKSDILEQRPLLADLWSEIKGQIDRFTTAELRAFKDKLFACEINVLLNKEDGGTSSKQICVDYYLDLNDKSVELDSIDILKARLFKIDFDLMTEKWADVQKSIKNLHNNKINNYSISTFYYHYFACTVNKALDYKLNTLKTDLKLGKDIVLGSSSPSAKYTADTHIVTAIPNNQYFNNTIENLKKVSDYFSLIAKLKGPWPEFTESFHGKCQDSTVQCAFLIMYEILRNDDEVPKMLLMKYIIDVLQNPESKKSDYECIFDIYCYSILFTASSGKKNSQQLTRIVMSENWIEKLKEASAAMYQKNINKIVYNRPVTEDGNVTEKSGQYLPKYIFAIKEFYKLSSDAKRLDIKKRPLFVFLSNKSASAEHFFINQSYNFEFVYGNNRKATIPCPKKLKKYISYSANYLYVNYEDNASMEELSIFDKIQFLKAKGKSVFSCSWCNKYFLKAREIFESGKYPNNLNTITDESTAKEMVLEYYNRYFEDELKQYISSLNNIA